MSVPMLPTRRATRYGAAVVVAIGLLGGYCETVQAETVWLTGTTLRKQLDQPVSFTWSGTPLRKALENLSQLQQVAVYIDRRVDPGREVELACDNRPLKEAFGLLAQHTHLGVCLFGPIVYFGPADYTARLRTLAELRREDLRKLPSAVGRQFSSAKRMQWDDFAQPRKLIEQLGQASGIEISGADRIPHDLWAGADLPPLALIDRFTLLLGQFGLTFKISADAKTITLVPIPDDLALVRDYPGGRQPKVVAKKFSALVPNARIKVVGKKVFVRGLLEDHERLRDGPKSSGQPKSAPTELDKQRFTVREAKGPVRELINQLAGQLKLEVRVDRKALEQAGISLDQRVTFSVTDATVDELLQAVLKPAGLTFRRDGQVLEIGVEQ